MLLVSIGQLTYADESALPLAQRESHAILILFLLYYRLSVPHSLYLPLLCFSCFTTGARALSLSIYIPAPQSASPARHLLRAARGVCVRSVSTCTFAPVKQVKKKILRAVRAVCVRSVSICAFVPAKPVTEYLREALCIQPPLMHLLLLRLCHHLHRLHL